MWNPHSALGGIRLQFIYVPIIFVALLVAALFVACGDGSDNRAAEVSVALSNLPDDPTADDVRDEIEAEVDDEDDARRIANAVNSAIASGVSLQQIIDAVDDLGDGDADEVREAIRNLSPASVEEDGEFEEFKVEILGILDAIAASNRDLRDEVAEIRRQVDEAERLAELTKLWDEIEDLRKQVSVAQSRPVEDGDNGSGNECQPGDKVGTWSEGNNPYRIEFGGHGKQHGDLYPSVGVKTISYIFEPGIDDPSGVPDIFWGFGSVWEWNPPGCEYDLVKDATNYARARLDSGHSGLVVRWGSWEVVGNVANMPDSAIESLLSSHREAMGDKVASGNNNGGTCEAVRQSDATRPNGADSVVTIGGDGHAYVFELWNPAVQGGREMKVLIPAGEARTFTGFGGAIWQYPTSCSEAQIREDFERNPKPTYTG